MGERLGSPVVLDPPQIDGQVGCGLLEVFCRITQGVHGLRDQLVSILRRHSLAKVRLRCVVLLDHRVACCLHLLRDMPIKTAVIPILGAGAALAIIGFVAARRELPNQRLFARGTKAVKAVQAVQAAMTDSGTELDRSRATAHARRSPTTLAAGWINAAELPHDTVLPIAFWDAAAELDADDEAHRRASLSESQDAYDTFDADELSAEWLTRATQSPPGDEFDVLDDPAEIAADSMSMISEASRSAASRDLTDADEEDEDRA